MTNNEKINAMSVEEKAKMFEMYDFCPCTNCSDFKYCRDCIIDWLESEVEDNG